MRTADRVPQKVADKRARRARRDRRWLQLEQKPRVMYPHHPWEDDTDGR